MPCSFGTGEALVCRDDGATSSVEDGRWSTTFIVRDLAGNETRATSHSVVFDNTPPYIIGGQRLVVGQTHRYFIGDALSGPETSYVDVPVTDARTFWGACRSGRDRWSYTTYTFNGGKARDRSGNEIDLPEVSYQIGTTSSICTDHDGGNRGGRSLRN